MYLNDKKKIGEALKAMLPGAVSAASNAFQNQGNEQWSAPQCGKRPFFIGRRRNEWEQCKAIAMQQQQTAPSEGPQGPQPSTAGNFIANNKNALLIGGAVVGGLILFTMLKK